MREVPLREGLESARPRMVRIMASSSQPATLVGEIQAQVITPLAASLASSSPLLDEQALPSQQAIATRAIDVAVSLSALLVLAPLLLLLALLIRLDSSGPVLFRQTCG